MRFTVGKKIGGGFSIVVILLLIVFFYTFSVVNKAIKSNDKFLNVDQPSLFVINQLKDNISKTHTYMQQWVIDESRPDEQFKIEAQLMLDSTIKSDLDTIDQLSNKWMKESGGVEEFKNMKSPNKESLERLVNDLINKHKTNFKGVGQPLRIALVGSRFGPGIYNIVLSLTKDEVVKRISKIN